MEHLCAPGEGCGSDWGSLGKGLGRIWEDCDGACGVHRIIGMSRRSDNGLTHWSDSGFPVNPACLAPGRPCTKSNLQKKVVFLDARSAPRRWRRPPQHRPEKRMSNLRFLVFCGCAPRGLAGGGFSSREAAPAHCQQKTTGQK